MPNPYVLKRLEGIRTILVGVHQASSALSSSSKGNERQAFIDTFLEKVLPPIYRFGSGDATDANGHRTGQLDVVVEYPIAPSLPGVGGSPTRLYLAESIAAVVEVKSDVAAQWNQALHTAEQLAPLRRRYSTSMTMGGIPPTAQIPLLVAGYTGWKDLETVRKQVKANRNVAGVLVIDSGIFYASIQGAELAATGPWSLWGLITILHLITNRLLAAATTPFDYAK